MTQLKQRVCQETRNRQQNRLIRSQNFQTSVSIGFRAWAALFLLTLPAELWAEVSTLHLSSEKSPAFQKEYARSHFSQV